MKNSMEAVRAARRKPAFEVETVTMDTVPDPPVTEQHSRYNDLYAKVRSLGLGERNAVKVRLADKAEFLVARGRLRTLAKKEGLRALSSRSDDYRVGYFWIVKPE